MDSDRIPKQTLKYLPKWKRSVGKNGSTSFALRDKEQALLQKFAAHGDDELISSTLLNVALGCTRIYGSHIHSYRQVREDQHSFHGPACYTEDIQSGAQQTTPQNLRNAPLLPQSLFFTFPAQILLIFYVFIGCIFA
jgi:hypothetical protein